VVEVVLSVVIGLLPSTHGCAIDQIVLVGRSIASLEVFVEPCLWILGLSFVRVAGLGGFCERDVVALEDLHFLLHSLHLSKYASDYFFSSCNCFSDVSHRLSPALLFFLLLLLLATVLGLDLEFDTFSILLFCG
jgi:hypothetical protein